VSRSPPSPAAGPASSGARTQPKLARLINVTKVAMMIKPIRTDRDHAKALARVDAIFAARPNTPEFDELDVLATLIDADEREHHPIDPPSPVEAIRFRMEQGQISRADLAHLLGGSAKVAEVLRGKRALSKAMIVRLHRHLAIPYDVLLGDIEPVSVQARKRPANSKRQSRLRATRGSAKRNRPREQRQAA
jgi:HTH-type transcriptional regulator/antitoxin HigA